MTSGILHAWTESNIKKFGHITGPRKLASNLCRGLDLIGADYKENEIGEMNGCLDGYGRWVSFEHREVNLPRNTLMGPNIIQTPVNDLLMWDEHDNFVVPSEWVRDMYHTGFETFDVWSWSPYWRRTHSDEPGARFKIPETTNIFVWPVGIDTEKFSSSSGIIKTNQQQRCLIYFKNREESQLQHLLDHVVRPRKFEPIVLRYGQYTEDEFIAACSLCSFAVVLSNTETQGIAYQEMMSMGLPCYILDHTVWKLPVPWMEQYAGFPRATSAPYFDESRCGILCKNPSRFEEFLDNLDNYSPRDYVLENLTLEKSATKYMDIITSIHRP